MARAQGTNDLAGMHVPEPWNGALETAPILFISWNPSWNPAEQFPTHVSRDRDVISFFRDRFDHTNQASQTWREMKGIATHLLGRKALAGVDYSMTDVVRCKSRKGIGAASALGRCVSLYLARTIMLSEARVIVSLGRDARNAVATFFGVAPELGFGGVVSVEQRDRALVFLGAPGSSQPRRLHDSDLAEVRIALAGGS